MDWSARPDGEPSSRPAWVKGHPRAVALTALLAARLQAVVPDGFILRSDDGWLTIYHRHAPFLTTSTGVGAIMGDEDEGRLASAVWAVMSAVQDFVSEDLREPWPLGGPGKQQFFMPETEVDGSTLRMWFGDRNQPTLVVGDIDLSALP